jgi:hypothetical protein
MASGFRASSLAFGPDGALYVLADEGSDGTESTAGFLAKLTGEL